MGRKRSRGKSFIRQCYRALSVANTAGVIFSGNPRKIVRHMARKKTTKLGAMLIRPTK